MKTTQSLLQLLVDRLNKELPTRDFSLDHSNYGYRLMRNGGSVHASPRLKAKELDLWICGMLESIGHAENELRQYFTQQKV